MIFGTSLFWRETMKPARFLIFEARLVLVVMLFIMHMRFWTFMLVLISMAILTYFQRKGVSVNAIARWLKTKFIGKRRSARGTSEERGAVDFGWEADRWLAAELASRKRVSSGETAVVANEPALLKVLKMIPGMGPPKQKKG